MFFLLSKKLAWVALPGAWVVALLALAFLLRRHRVLAGLVLFTACATLGALSTPRIVNLIDRALAASGRTTMRPEVEYDVAVVLAGGGGIRMRAGADAVLRGRARYLLYSGAVGPHSVAMVTSRLDALGIPADRVVIDPRSRNTRENAVESARIVAARGWRSVLVVTSAPHVERALGCFRAVGLEPDVLSVPDPAVPGRRPRLFVLARSSELLHELIGRAVYRLAGFSAS